MKKIILLMVLFHMLSCINIFACDLIVTWHKDDREFFSGYTRYGGAYNDPETRYIGYGHTSTPTTKYAAPSFHHSDNWTGIAYIYSYSSNALAAVDFANQDIFYRGGGLKTGIWLSQTSDELLQGLCDYANWTTGEFNEQG